MRRDMLRISAIVLLGLIFLLVTRDERTLYAAGAGWPLQFGSAGDEGIGRIITDHAGAVYIVGSTDGNLYGASDGADDCFIAKYNANGTFLWGKQFGSTEQDNLSSAAVDSRNNLYVVGDTLGDLFAPQAGKGDPLQETGDVCIAKLSPDGNVLWSKQFGTTTTDFAIDVVVDSQDNIYIAGDTSGSLFGANAFKDPQNVGTSDVFLVKYDPSGNQLWSKQFGTDGNDSAQRIRLDSSGNIYIGGQTSDLFGQSKAGYDAFLAKFTPDGTLLWGKQFGSENVSDVFGLCIDKDGNTYVGGDTNLHTDEDGDADTSDGYVSKFDPNGNLLWTQQWSTPGGDVVTDLALDGQGNLYAVGTMYSNLSALMNLPPDGISVIYRYDLNGSQRGAMKNFNGLFGSCAMDDQGDLYVVGATDISAYGTNAGGTDVFVLQGTPSSPLAMTVHRPTKVAKAPLHPLEVHVGRSIKQTGKAVAVVWAGKPLALNYPPLVMAGRPYVYVGYLSYGVQNARITFGKHKDIAIVGRKKRIVIYPGALRYSINGQYRRMAAKPIMLGGHCYVPLEVLCTVTPVSIHYDANAKVIRFDPPRLALR